MSKKKDADLEPKVKTTPGSPTQAKEEIEEVKQPGDLQRASSHEQSASHAKPCNPGTRRSRYVRSIRARANDASIEDALEGVIPNLEKPTGVHGQGKKARKRESIRIHYGSRAISVETRSKRQGSKSITLQDQELTCKQISHEMKHQKSKNFASKKATGLEKHVFVFDKEESK